MKLRYNTSFEDWDNFIKTSPQKSIFITSKFLKSLNTNFDLITCTNDNNEIIAGCPIILDNDDKAYKNIYPFTQYVGIILKNFSEYSNHKKISKEFKITEFFIDELIKKYKHIAISQHYNFTDLRPFQWYNYHQKENGVFNINISYSPILNLSHYNSYNDYYDSIRPVRRQEYKKNVSKIKLIKTDNTDILVNLHKKTFERQGIVESNEQLKLVKSITQSALTNNYGDLTVAYLDEVPISAILFLYYGQTAYYMFGANDYEYRNLFANNLIMLDLIKRAFETDIKEIDFVGANSPNRGDYKISYNGDLKHFYILNY